MARWKVLGDGCRRGRARHPSHHETRDDRTALDFHCVDAAAVVRFRSRYHAKHSIRHNAIAIGGGKVYLIDRPLAAKDLLLNALKGKEQPSGDLICLDAKTGKELWRTKDRIYGTTLAFGPPCFFQRSLPSADARQ